MARKNWAIYVSVIVQIYKLRISHFVCYTLSFYISADHELCSSGISAHCLIVLSFTYQLLPLSPFPSIIMTRIAVATLLAILASNVVAAPTFHKRIAQTISASTQKWEASCLAAGGADKCNPLSIKAFSTLLAAAGPCEQQDAADEMIDLAKTLTNNTDMVEFTQIFVQQPRNSVCIPLRSTFAS